MSFLEEGKKVEKKFASLFEDATFSTTKEDITQHWDVSIPKDKFSKLVKLEEDFDSDVVRVDVKKVKCRLRSEGLDESIHWVELKNVNGKLGWLYGEADYFAFEVFKYFIIVEKDKLQKFIAENTIKEFTLIPIKGKLYKRKSRPKEATTLVSTFDLVYISSGMIPKCI